MAWLLLVLAGIGEIIGVSGFQRLTRGVSANGLVRLVGGFALGLICLHGAMASLPMTVAYSVFTALGTAGATLLGIVFWGDPARPLRLACIGAIVIAVVGIKATL